MIIDASQQSSLQLYHAMTQTIIPRPIAWVLTDNGLDKVESQAQAYNLAPFSYFTPISSNPPLLMFSVGKKPESGVLKDTAVNAIACKRFVVHIPSSQHAKAVNETAATLPFGDSEVEAAALELVDFPGFELPRLADCAIVYACELYDVKEIGHVPQTLIFGEVKQIYIADDVSELIDGKRLQVDAEAVQPLARLGAEGYWVDGKVIREARPK